MNAAQATPSTSTVHGVCNLCEAICGVMLTITQRPEGPEVTSIRGNKDDPLSRGHICPKGVAMADVYTDPDRLRRPIRRLGRGAEARWEEINWTEAIDLAVTGLTDVQSAHGRDAVGVYLGNPNVHSLGSMTHGSQVVKALGSRNVFSATSVDQLPQQLVAMLTFGHQLMLPITDLDHTDFFLVFGANPMASNGSLMTVPDFPQRLRELRARGGRMVVFDPRRTETAKQADEHHFIRPGTDAYVLLAMLRTLYADGLTRPGPHVKGVAEVEQAVRDFTPGRAEEVSGVPAADIVRLTGEYAAAGAAAAYGRMGVSTQEFGTVCAWAITCLNTLTGNLDRRGGAMFTHPAVDLVGRSLVGRGHHDKWRSRVRGLPETGGELPAAVMAEEMLTPGHGQIKALVTSSGNPVLSTPAGHRLEEAIGSLDFMVSIDLYVNETTRHADVILPPTSSLERDHYDLVFHALAVRNTARFTPAVFDKPSGARHDWEIYRDLALGLLARRSGRASWKARVVTAARLRLSPTRLIDVLLRTGKTRLSVRALTASADGVDLGPLQPCLPERLQTPDRMVDLAPSLVLAELARLAAREPEPHDPEALVLIGRRHQRDCNSWLHNTTRLTKGRPRHQLYVHPIDAQARGINDGDVVEVSSRVGAVNTEVLLTDDVMPGVVSLPHGYGHAKATHLGNAQHVTGVSINDLTDPELLDVSGNAAFSAVPVQVSSR